MKWRMSLSDNGYTRKEVGDIEAAQQLLAKDVLKSDKIELLKN
jgi:hypothetical protein